MLDRKHIEINTHHVLDRKHIEINTHHVLDRKHIGEKKEDKGTNTDLQNITQKTKD